MHQDDDRKSSGSSFAANLSCEDVRSYTHDIGETIAEIREKDKISGSCKKYFTLIDSKTGELKTRNHSNSAEAARQLVLCGKEMFFYLGMRSGMGMPINLVSSLLESFPEVTGKKFEKLGLLTDSSIQNEEFPLGLVSIKNSHPVSLRSFMTKNPQQISCAACHVNHLPDGRIAVGMPNDKFDLGVFNALTIYPFWKMDGAADHNGKWDPELTKYYKKLEAQEEQQNKKNMLSNLGILANIKMPKRVNINIPDIFSSLLHEDVPPVENQRTFLKGGPGVFNLMSPMMNVKGKEFYVSLPQIWDMDASKNSHGPIGTVNLVASLEDFIGQAVLLTTMSPKYESARYLDPLTTYLRCLKTPQNPQKRQEALYAKGSILFKNNCIKCHDGPNGEGLRSYPGASIGSPLVFEGLLKNYTPPDIQSRAVVKSFEKTGIKINAPDGMTPRRLNGIWVRKYLMANGSIKNMDHLFCLNGQKRVSPDRLDPLTDGVHSDLCEQYSTDEKESLKEYLNFYYGNE